MTEELYGDVPEWIKGAVLKTVDGAEPSVSSNLTVSANRTADVLADVVVRSRCSEPVALTGVKASHAVCRVVKLLAG